MEVEYETIAKNDKNRRYFWRQMFVCLTTSTIYFMIGLTGGSPTVALPQLNKEANSTSEIAIELSSWINSMVPFSAVFWVLVLVIVSHHFGRKKPMVAISLNSFIGYIIFCCSKDISQIFISQFIQGLTQAAFTTTCGMMVLEYTTPQYRGLFLGFFSATLFWGMWVANSIGIFVNFRYIGFVGIICSIYTFFAFIFIPESPYWLACRGRYDECVTVHRWLKGAEEDAEKELSALIKLQKHINERMIKKKKSIKDYITELAQILKSPEIYKPTLLIFLTMAGFLLSGKVACAIYAVEIMKKITTREYDAFIGVLILDGISVAGMYAGSFISTHFKRRTLLIGCSGMCVLFLLMLSGHLFLIKMKILSENVYVSIFLLAGFTLASCVGPIVTANQIWMELYPVKHRTYAMCIICVGCKLIYGITVKITPYVFEQFQTYGAFLFFAVNLTVCIILWYKCLPETKDKTIQEISESFIKKNQKNSKERNFLTTHSTDAH